MELLYRNNYGATYRVTNSANPACIVQLIIDSVGLYMSKADLDYLMNIVLKSNVPCSCNDCGGDKCNKIWCSNPLVDICLKVDEPILHLMEDLIKGTQFMLEMNDTLDEFRLK